MRQEVGPAITRRSVSSEGCRGQWLPSLAGSWWHWHRSWWRWRPRYASTWVLLRNWKTFLCVFFLQYSAWTSPTRCTSPFAKALVATHHSPIVCRFAAGSGAGGSRSRAGSRCPRPNPELVIEKPDRQPAARGWVRCRRIEEPGRQPKTKLKLVPALGNRETGAAAGDPRLGLRPCRGIEEPKRQPAHSGDFSDLAWINS